MNQKFKYLPHQLAKSPAFKDAKIYYLENKLWLDVDRAELFDEDLIEATIKAKDNCTHIKSKSLGGIVFILEDQKILVVTTLSVNTQSKTIEKHFNRLQEYLSSAKSNYNAYHDELTGVLNRHGIRDSIERAYHAAGASMGGNG